MQDRVKKFMIVSDIHGDEWDEPAATAALSFMKKFDPDIRVINGDLFDFACLRAGAKDSLGEKGKSLRRDFEIGIHFMGKFFSSKKNSKYTNHFLRGNHDERLWDIAKNSQNGVERDFASQGIKEIEEQLEKFNAGMTPYNSRCYFSIGHLRVHHGLYTGESAARKHAEAYGNVVFGHTHSITSYKSASINPHIAYNSGCLCKLDLDYAKSKAGTLKWQHGWGYGLVYPDGTFSYHQAIGVNNQFVVADNLSIIKYNK